MSIKFILLIFIIFAVFKILNRWKKKEIDSRQLIIWLIFWSLAALAVIWPKTTDIVAQFVGVSRGADLLIYVSIFVIFFIIFKIMVKVEKIEQNITKIVREVALEDKNKEDWTASELSRMIILKKVY